MTNYEDCMTLRCKCGANLIDDAIVDEIERDPLKFISVLASLGKTRYSVRSLLYYAALPTLKHHRCRHCRATQTLNALKILDRPI